jgi:hypothetical protein
LGGVFAAGLIVLAEAAEPSLSPNWGDYVLAGTAFPFLGVCTQAVSTLFSQSIFLLFAVLVINRVRIRGSRRGSLTALLIILLGFGLAGSSSIPTLPSWLILGVGFTLALGIVYWLLFRVSPASAVTAVAALAVLRGVRQAIQDAYPAALPASIVSIGLILVLVFLWQRSWRDHPQELWKRM